MNDTELRQDQLPHYFGFGVRRRKGDLTLDVTYPYIHHQRYYDVARTVISLKGLPLGQNGFIALETTDIAILLQRLSQLNLSSDCESVTLLQDLEHVEKDHIRYYDVDIVFYAMYDKDSAIVSTEEAYFKLQLLSQRWLQPHGQNLDGLFGILPNIAWTNYGPMLPEDVNHERVKHIFSKPLMVTHVDKFPYLVNYHIPDGVRIASGSQVRLGAYLGNGTTVMPAGYVNFNAGTAGAAMVEGRISAGVTVGAHSDLGGGASVMGTLSGGNDVVISIGEKCLIGANAGTGISLGFGCTIAAGLYVYGGMKIYLYDGDKKPVNLEGNRVSEGDNIVKAADLSGRDHLLFIQDSRTGRVACYPNQKTIALNKALHAN